MTPPRRPDDRARPCSGRRYRSARRRPGRLGPLLVTGLAAAGGPGGPGDLAAQRPEPDRAVRTEVTDVAFPGATALDPAVLREAIVTRATECRSPLFAPACLLGDFDWAHSRAYLDPAEVERDRERIELLYEAWGYPRAVATAFYDSAAPKTGVRFRVEEGAPLVVESLELRGLDAFDPPIPRPDLLPLRPGEPYALPRLAMIEAWLKDRMAERGHPFGELAVSGAVNETARTAALVLEPDPGPVARFGPVRIATEPPIEDAVVASVLRFGSGEDYSLTALRESEKALYRLPIVQRAVIQPAVARPPEGDSVTVPVDVAVFPRRTRGFEVEGTVSSTECLTAAVFWRHRYFLGEPRLFSIGAGATHLLADRLEGSFPCTSTGTGTYAEPQYFIEADVRQPWPGHPETQLHLGVAAYRSAAPDVYVQDGYRLTTALSHVLADDLVAMIRYGPARNRLEASRAYFCGTYGICDEPGARALERAAWLAPAEILATWTPSGEPRQTVPPEELRQEALWAPPGWRYWVRAGFENAAAWTGSDFEYRRALAEVSVTRPLGTALALAGHVRAGWIDGSSVLPPQVRLYAGGLYSVRGLAENMLGPATLVTDPAGAAALGCDGGCPAGLVVGPEPVSVRPTGGDRVLEGSVEARLWVSETLQLATFVDAGALRRDRLQIDGDEALPEGWSGEVTPGVGLRVLTNLGPIRLDVGYDLSGARERPLFASDDDGDLDYLGRVRFDPFGHDEPAPVTEAIRRLQVHIGIGQPF